MRAKVSDWFLEPILFLIISRFYIHYWSFLAIFPQRFPDACRTLWDSKVILGLSWNLGQESAFAICVGVSEQCVQQPHIMAFPGCLQIEGNTSGNPIYFEAANKFSHFDSPRFVYSSAEVSFWGLEWIWEEEVGSQPLNNYLVVPPSFFPDGTWFLLKHTNLFSYKKVWQNTRIVVGTRVLYD